MCPCEYLCVQNIQIASGSTTAILSSKVGRWWFVVKPTSDESISSSYLPFGCKVPPPPTVVENSLGMYPIFR